MVPPPFRLPVLYFPAKIAQPPCAQQSKKAVRQEFSPEEDQKLKDLVMELGESNWNEVANRIGTRTARQCRERFKNYLSPSIKNDPWTEEDNETLRLKYAEFGPKWSQIAKFFPTRSEVNIKNHWTLLYNKNNREHDLKEEKRQLIQQIDMVIENTKRLASPPNTKIEYLQEKNSDQLAIPNASSILNPQINLEQTDFASLFNDPNIPFDNGFGSIEPLGLIEWNNSDDQNYHLFECAPFYF